MFFSRVILSCVCVSWGVFCAIKRNCIVLYCRYDRNSLAYYLL